MAQRSSQSVSKSDMEGILEKVGTSITSKLIPGKAKFFCELHGALLSIYKENKRSSTFSQQIDMNVVQMVRKSSSDKSGNSFEILCNNKAQVFCAPSAEECSIWVQHLQRAMTLKDQTDVRHQIVNRDSVRLADYEDITVDIGTISMKTEISSPTIPAPSSRTMSISSEYAEVDFHNLPASSMPSHTKEYTVSCSDSAGIVQSIENDENDYAMIGDGLGKGSEDQVVQLRSSVAADIRSSLAQPHVSPQSPAAKAVAFPATGTENSLTGSSSQPPELQTVPPVRNKRGGAPPAFIPPPPPTSPPPEVMLEDCGYSRIDVDMNMKDGPGQEAVPVTESQDADFGEGNEKDSEGYTKVKVKHHTSRFDFDIIKEVEEQEGADDHCDSEEDYVEGFSDRSASEPILKFPSPLTEEDEEPLANLQEFLSNNRRICRPSFKDFGFTEDPIGDLKTLLLKLQA